MTDFLFIGGCPRSGTTALMDVLNGDERIAVGKERFKHRPDVTPRLFEADHFLAPRREETNLLDEPFYELLAERVRRGRLDYIGDKVPAYFRRFDQLHRVFESPKLFMLVRDPVRVACSFNRRSKSPSEGWSTEKDYRDAVRQWNDSLRRAHSFIDRRGLDSLFLVKYEWLFCGDERYLEAVYGFLGLDLAEVVRAHFERATADWPKRRRRKLSLSEGQVREVRDRQDVELAAWADRTAMRQIAVFGSADGAGSGHPERCAEARAEQWEIMLSSLRAGDALSTAAPNTASRGAAGVTDALQGLFEDVRDIERSRSWGAVSVARRLLATFTGGAAPARHSVSERIRQTLERARLHEQLLTENAGSSASFVRLGRSRYCPLCGVTSPAFLPFGKTERPNAKCPQCHSLERHRLVWLYIERCTDILERRQQPLRLLLLAPEEVLERRLRRVPGLECVRCDLVPGGPAIGSESTSLEFPDEAFDVIVGSAVLERIPDDAGAMRAMRRVLGSGGMAIICTSVRRGRTTGERGRSAGGGGRVRVYGVDIVDRLFAAGFYPELRTVDDIASPREQRRMALGGRTIVVANTEPLDSFVER